MVINSSRTKSSGPVLRSVSPSGRFYGGVSSPSSSGFASSTSSSFSSTSFFSNSRQQQPHHRSASPTRVNLFSSTPLNQSFRYSIDNRSVSPNQSVAVSKKPSSNKMIADSSRRRTCMCSPTTHPGSFRCGLHKNVANPHGQGAATSYSSNNGLNMRRSAMTNSLVRIGGVEGEWVRRALTTLIRPSSHQLKRRSAYQPRPSRLSSMSKAEEGV
ncbi:cell wall integrity and stress response component 1 [Raphanus sativus]|uniref:Cell wall integrity and stress response component 1 n=1 Tax=Raphanus sativus TaxID=3726 RepID=A0A6J0NKL8_RAPSA|nr:cell wall integrity and stress response component 1 [Raphanus sativus]